MSTFLNMKLNLGKKTREKHSSPPPTFKNASIFLITLICVLPPCCLEFACIKGLSGVFHHIISPSLFQSLPPLQLNVSVYLNKKIEEIIKRIKKKNSKSAFYSNSNDKKYDYKSYHHFEHGIN